MAVLYNFIRPR